MHSTALPLSRNRAERHTDSDIKAKAREIDEKQQKHKKTETIAGSLAWPLFIAALITS